MSYVIIGIVQPNKCRKDTGKDEIEKLIEFRTVDFDNMMDQVVDCLGQTPEMIGDTTIVCETGNNIIQMMYLDYAVNGLTCCDEIENQFASFLSREMTYGTVVIINSKIVDDGTCVPDSVGIDMVYNAFWRGFHHLGVFIRVDSRVEEFEFDDNLKDIVGRKLNVVKGIGIKFLGFDLLCFVDMEPKEGINRTMTKLHGSEIIYGDAVVVLKSNLHDGVFDSINKDVFAELIRLTMYTMEERELKEDERVVDKKIGDKVVVMNKYRILKGRMGCVTKCHHCKLDSKLTCGGCYRIMYCSKKCQEQDWNKHRIECLYKKKPLHQIIQTKSNQKSN